MIARIKHSDLWTLMFHSYYRNRKLAAYVVWMSAINALGLNQPYSRLLCRMGKYKQYQPGVCGYCGEKHT